MAHRRVPRVLGGMRADRVSGLGWPVIPHRPFRRGARDCLGGLGEVFPVRGLEGVARRGGHDQSCAVNGSGVRQESTWRGRARLRRSSQTACGISLSVGRRSGHNGVRRERPRDEARLRAAGLGSVSVGRGVCRRPRERWRRLLSFREQLSVDPVWCRCGAARAVLGRSSWCNCPGRVERRGSRLGCNVIVTRHGGWLRAGGKTRCPVRRSGSTAFPGPGRCSAFDAPPSRGVSRGTTSHPRCPTAVG